MIDTSTKKHYIAIIGGSISGSESAFILAKKGYRVVVFEMNNLPYGKIEDGLPKWHINLRNKQEQNIDQRLNHKNISFIPNVKIGRDISFDDLFKNWKFTVVILANGAWKDRNLPIDNINKFIGNGLVYQNALMYWYNHKHEPDYNGPNYKINDGTVVIGGGLSSLDVMKLGMIELVQNALLKHKSLNIDLFTFEKKGILKVLDELGVSFKDLNIKGMTLIYRRNATDMPLKSPRNNSNESILKAREVSKKLLHKYAKNFMFQFIPLSTPIEKIEVSGKLKGIIFQKNKIVDYKLIPVKEEIFEIKTTMVISSIGSLPEKITGLPYNYSILKMKNGYRVNGFSNVFAIGNAVTGRGNIIESKKHGAEMTNKIIEDYLLKDDFTETWLINYNKSIRNKVKEQMDEIETEIESKKNMPDSVIETILNKVQKLQEKVGYNSYESWIKAKTPIRLEDMLTK